MQTLFLTDSDVRQVFDWTSAIAALRDAYRSETTEAMFPPRIMARGSGIWLRCLGGILPGQKLMGSKQIAAVVSHKRVSYLISIFNSETAALDALLDGNFITGARTAATSALAADALAPPGPLEVAVIGSGYEAKMHMRALKAIGRIKSIRVYSPTPSSRERFASEIGEELGIDIQTCNSADEAVSGARLVICAARSSDETPIIKGAWLSVGTVVVSIGSTLPEQREIDPETIDRASLIVADMAEEVAHDTGDMIAATAAGVNFKHKLHPLSDLIAGKLEVPRSVTGIFLYKSVGAGLQDLAVAAMCVREARNRRIGTDSPISISTVQK